VFGGFVFDPGWHGEVEEGLQVGCGRGVGGFRLFQSKVGDGAIYAGMVLAEVDGARGAHGSGGGKAAMALPPLGLMSAPASRATSPLPSTGRRCTAKRAMWTALSVVGLLLMSQPDEGGVETPGWVFLTSLIPRWWEDEHRYWQSVGPSCSSWPSDGQEVGSASST
jgi:hypothetical protein